MVRSHGDQVADALFSHERRQLRVGTRLVSRSSEPFGRRKQRMGSELVISAQWLGRRRNVARYSLCFEAVRCFDLEQSCRVV
jgi:hypothetical protein